MSDEMPIDAPNFNGEGPAEQDHDSLIDPETGWSRPMVELLSRSIRAANEIHPSSWCIHSWGTEPIVAVEFINIGSIGPTIPYELIVSTDELDKQQSLLVSTYKQPTRVFSGRPWAAYLHIPRDQLQTVLVSLEAAHLLAVQRLAGSVRSKAMRWKWHRDDVSVEFERIAGIPIPQPEYMQELRELTKRSSGEQPILEHVAGRQYWKFSAGPKAKNWERLWEESFIGIDR